MARVEFGKKKTKQNMVTLIFHCSVFRRRRGVHARILSELRYFDL